MAVQASTLPATVAVRPACRDTGTDTPCWWPVLGHTQPVKAAAVEGDETKVAGDKATPAKEPITAEAAATAAAATAAATSQYEQPFLGKGRSQEPEETVCC